MLTPYIYKTWDQDYKDAAAEALLEEEFIANQVRDVTLAVAEYGATPTPQQMAALNASLNALAENYVRLREIQLRIKVIASEAASSGKSILGYTPTEISRQADLRAVAYDSITLDLRSAITSTVRQQDLLRLSSNISSAIGVLGEAVGPVYDAAMVWKSFSEGNDYAGIANSISGVVGVLAGALVTSLIGSTSLPITLLVGIISGAATTVLGAIVERTLVRFDVLDIDELTPDINNIEALKRLTDIRELIDTLDFETPPIIALSMLDAAAGKPGEHIDSFFEIVRNYFDGGTQFATVEDLTLALRQSNFENNRQGYLLVDLSNLSSEQLYSRAIENSDVGRSIRYALINAIPFATGIIEGTTANAAAYDLDNFSESYLRDRALFLRGYLDGMQDETISQLNSEGGIEVSTDAFSHGDFYIEDISASVVVKNFEFSPMVTGITFGSENNDVIQGGINIDRLYGGEGNDVLEGLGGNDYLEGGIGADVLRGGEGKDILVGGIGNDRYEFTGDFGADTIIDSDGTGSIWIGGTQLQNLNRVKGTDNVYENKDKNIQAVLIDEGGSTTLLISTVSGSPHNGSVTIKHWNDGELGIALEAAPVTPVTDGVVTLTGNGDGNHLGYHDVPDALRGTLRSLIIDGGSGKDMLTGLVNGSDTLNGGDGNDWISGGFNYSLIAGMGLSIGAGGADSGTDLIDGGAGDDLITVSGRSSVARGGADRDMLLSGFAVVTDIKDFTYSQNEQSITINADAIWQDISQFWQHGYSVSESGSLNLWTGIGEMSHAGVSVSGRAFQLDMASPGYEADREGIHGVNYLGMTQPGPLQTSWLSLAYDGFLAPLSLIFTPLSLDASLTLEAVASVKGANLFGDAGDDLLVGNWFADYLSGGADNDLIMGRAGHDVLEGGDGKDSIYGGVGDDTIAGGTGDDYLAGLGYDQIGSADDGARADEYEAFSDNDVIYGGDGDDTLEGFRGDDHLDGGADNDLLHGGEDNDILMGGAGSDILYGGNGSDDASGDDYLDGGDGDDFLYGAAGDDTLLGGKGDDQLFGLEGNNYLEGGEGNDRIVGGSQNDTIMGGAGDDEISGGGGNDIIDGGTGINKIEAGEGNDWINAGEYGAYLDGGLGNDTFVFDSGSARIRYENGFAIASTLIDTGGTNTLVLGGASYFYDIQTRVQGNDLILYFNDDEAILIKNGLNGAITNFTNRTDLGEQGTVYDLPFEDNAPTGEWLVKTNLNSLLLSTLNDSISRTAQNAGESIAGGQRADNLYAHAGGSTLTGGRGNDYLYGGAGDDVYVLRRGDGNDAINELGGSNTIALGEGIAQENVTVRFEYGADLLVSLDTGESIAVYSMRSHDGVVQEDTAVQTLRFANGAEWGIERILQEAVKPTEGNDSLYGYDQENILYGEAGNDNLYGANHNDRLIGGRGNDYLRGGQGDDEYVYQLGDGSDSIFDHQGLDKLVFGEGIDPDTIRVVEEINTYDPSLSSIVLVLPDGSRITLTQALDANASQLNDSYSIESMVFANGSQWSAEDLLTRLLDPTKILFKGSDNSETIVGSSGGDILIGGKGDDVLQGGRGDDEYHFELGDGKDQILDADGLDKIVFGGGIDPDGITLRRHGANLLIEIDADNKIQINNNFFAHTGEVNIYSAVESIQFSTGEEWNSAKIKSEISTTGTNAGDHIYGLDTDDRIQGFDGNDFLYGVSGEDTLIGGKGDDLLDGGTGNDTYQFGRHDGNDVIKESWNDKNDVIEFREEIPGDQIKIRRDGANLVVSAGNGTTITVKDMFDWRTTALTSYAIEAIRFADGSSWNIDRIKAEALKGTTGNDIIYGFNGNDVISGGRGNDRIYGALGDDVYIFSSGDGMDFIQDSGGTDTIKFEAGIRPDDVLVHRHEASTYFIFQNGDQISSDSLIERIEFSNGEVWGVSDINDQLAQTAAATNMLLGGGKWDELHVYSSNDFYINGLAGDDDITGGSGNDTLVGGSGFNFLDGRGGNDTYLVTSDNVETIITGLVGNGDDRILFAQGISPDDVSATISYPTRWSELKDGVTYYWNLKDPYSTTDHSLYLHFGNSQVELRDLFKASAEGAILVDGSMADTVQFMDGTVWTIDDLMGLAMEGTNNNDEKRGTAGADYLSGGLGNDTLDGYNGNDTLVGGSGNDVLAGGDGDNIYVFGLDSGEDRINNASSYSTDKILFESGIAPEDISISRNYHDLVLKISADQSIHISNSFLNETGQERTARFIDAIMFSGGITWNAEQIIYILNNGGTYNGNLDFVAPETPTASINAEGSVINGIAEKGSNIFVADNSNVLLGSAIADINTGNYTVDLTSSLQNGDEVLITAVDAAGNISEPALVTATIAEQPPTYAAGLKGFYYGYHQPDQGNVNLANLTQVRNFIQSNDPDAQFISQSVYYMFARTLLGTGSVLQTFLAADADSLSADPGDTSDAILRMEGKVNLQAGTHNFRVRADDGYSILVDGEVVAEHNAKQGSTLRTHAAFEIATSGLHDLEIVYWDEGSSHDFRVEISHNSGATYQRLGGDILSHEVDGVTANNHYAFFQQDQSIIANDYQKPDAFAQVDNLVQAMAAFSPPAMAETRFAATSRYAMEPVIAVNW